MVVITEARRPVDPAELSGRERDTLSLSWEERRWTRKRVLTSGGREVALALPTGSVLQPGAILAVEVDWYLEIEARAEPVLSISPRDREEAIRVALEVGNRHFSLALDDESLLVPDDPAMEQLLRRLGVVWERRRAVYDPIGGGGAAGHRPIDGHTHGSAEHG